MKVLILVLAIAFSREMLKVIPYPSYVESGSETLEFSRCDFVLVSELDQAFSSILEFHKDTIFGDRSLCNSETTHPVSVFISQPENKETSECKSEEYELTINKTSISIKSECPVGLIRAVATLQQLMDRNDEIVDGKVLKERVIINEAPLIIRDKPRFTHRGIMIDTSRHFLKVETIRRVILGMSLAKLNVLHIHLFDDDSYSMHFKSIPGFTEDAAFSKAEMYSEGEIRSIVAYGKINGVEVIPELDIPGHTRAVGKHAPLKKIVTCFNSVWPYKIPDYYRIRGGPPTSALDPSMSETYDFLKKIFTDLTSYFESQYIHLGGDEVIFKCWKERKSIEEFMKKKGIGSYKELMNYFIKEARNVLEKVNSKKTAIYWSNPDTFDVKYKENDVLQYWGHSKYISRLKSIYPRNKVIMSPYDYLYLDCGVGNKYGGPSWCNNYKTWLQIYLFEPTAFGVDEANILGAEGAAWAEQIDDSNIELKFWPRMGSLAATLWEPKRTQIDLIKLVSGLVNLSKKLNEKGIPSNAIVKQYCEIHPEICFAKY